MGSIKRIVRFAFFCFTLPASVLHAGRGRWTNVGFQGTFVGPVAYALSNPAIAIVIAGAGTLFRTTDGARSWEQLLLPTPYPMPDGVPRVLAINDLAIDPDNPLLFYAAAGIFPLAPEPAPPLRGVLLKSVDGGATWTQAGEIFDEPVKQALIDPANPATLFVSCLGDGGYEFLRSDDSGQTWESIRSSLPGNLAYFVALRIDAAGPQRLYAELNLRTGTADFPTETSELRRSDDGGRNWSGPLTLPGVLSVGSDSTLYACAGALVWRSVDFGAHWAAGGSGLPSDAEIVVTDPQVPERLFIASIQHGLFVSIDRGATWTPFVDAGLPPPHHGLSLISAGYSLSISPDGSFLAAPSFFGLFELTLTFVEPVRGSVAVPVDPARRGDQSP